VKAHSSGDCYGIIQYQWLDYTVRDGQVNCDRRLNHLQLLTFSGHEVFRGRTMCVGERRVYEMYRKQRRTS